MIRTALDMLDPDEEPETSTPGNRNQRGGHPRPGSLPGMYAPPGTGAQPAGDDFPGTYAPPPFMPVPPRGQPWDVTYPPGPQIAPRPGTARPGPNTAPRPGSGQRPQQPGRNRGSDPRGWRPPQPPETAPTVPGERTDVDGQIDRLRREGLGRVYGRSREGMYPTPPMPPRRAPRNAVPLGLLHLLGSEGGRNGYNLMRAFAERSGGHFQPKSGTIYPALDKLVERGWATVDNGEYTLTDAGRQELHTNVDAAAALFNQPQAEEPAIQTAFRKLVGAYHQLATNGTETQQGAAVEKLDQLRRDIYGLLSE